MINKPKNKILIPVVAFVLCVLESIFGAEKPMAFQANEIAFHHLSCGVQGIEIEIEINCNRN